MALEKPIRAAYPEFPSLLDCQIKTSPGPSAQQVWNRASWFPGCASLSLPLGSLWSRSGVWTQVQGQSPSLPPPAFSSHRLQGSRWVETAVPALYKAPLLLPPVLDSRVGSSAGNPLQLTSPGSPGAFLWLPSRAFLSALHPPVPSFSLIAI